MMKCLILFIALLVAAPVTAQERYALVVGIDRYDNVTSLQKAGNDARAVSTALRSAGFEVTTLIDSNRRELTRALSLFTARLSPGDEAVFYFAGHGVEVDGRNFLLPADIPGMRPGEELFLINESLAADAVLSAIQGSGARVSIMILDACRDNPFPRNGTRSLGQSRGLARLDAPAGAFIMFSAGIGQSALDRLSNDDPNPNSVFTRTLLPLLTEPGLAIHEVARRLRREVQDLAESVGHVQRPAYYDEVTGEFVLQQAAAVATGPLVDEAPAEATAPTVSACDEALATWGAVGMTTSRAVLESFIQTYEASCPVLAELASARLEGLETRAASTIETVAAPQVDDAPNPVASSGPCTVPDFRVVGLLRGNLNEARLDAFLEDHPDCGAFSDYAREMLSVLRRSPDIPRMGITRPPAGPGEETTLDLDREERIEVQRMLSNLGFETGTPDGVLGPVTRAAISDYTALVGYAPSEYLSEPTLTHLRRAQAIAPRILDGVWRVQFNRFGDETWHRINDPENLDREVRDRALETLEVTIEDGAIVSHDLKPPNSYSEFQPGTVHSVTLNEDGRLRADVTSRFLSGDRPRSAGRLSIDVMLRPGHLSSVQRREVVGRYDDAYIAVIKITRLLREQPFP